MREYSPHAVSRQSQKTLFDLSSRDLDEMQQQAARDLELLRGKRLFITGGTGFFGKWLLAALCHAESELKLGMEVTVLSRKAQQFLERFPKVRAQKCLTFIEGDLLDFTMPPGLFDYLFHVATDTTTPSTTEGEAERTRTIIAGTERVLDLARSSGVARMLYVSSGAVYGTFAGQAHGAEEVDFARAVPATSYATAKRLAEELCAESGVPFVTARAFAFLGPYLPLNTHFAAGNFLRDALQGGPIVVRGDGTALRSYLYPTDLVIWLLRILLRGKAGEAYNVGSDEAVSTAQLAGLMADAVQPRPEVTIQSAQPQGPQNIYLPCIGRVEAELGLNVTVPLRESIARSRDFHRAL